MMTIEEAVEAVDKFRWRLPSAREELAQQFADEEFSEPSDRARFLQTWRKAEGFAAKQKQDQSVSDVAGNWPERKDY